MVKQKGEMLDANSLKMRGLGRGFRFGVGSRALLLYYNPPGMYDSSLFSLIHSGIRGVS